MFWQAPGDSNPTNNDFGDRRDANFTRRLLLFLELVGNSEIPAPRLQGERSASELNQQIFGAGGRSRTVTPFGGRF